MATKISLIIFIILFGTMPMFNVSISSFPEDKPTIYIEPAEILDLPPSTTFRVSIKLFNVSALYGFDMIFRWDPTILEYVSHSVYVPRNTYPDGILWNPVLPIKDEVDVAAGTYWIAYASMHPAPSFNGSGTFFNMTFHVKAQGSCYLNFDSTDLGDKKGNPIFHYVKVAYFSNAPPPPPPQPAKVGIAPTRIIDATITPCTNFGVNVTVQQAVDLFKHEFKLSYNTAILDCVGVSEGPFLQSTGPTSIIYNEIDEYAGIIRFGVTLLVSPGVNGSGVLATISFHVTGTGESFFDLYDVTLENSKRELIPLDGEPTDGYFNNILITKLFVHPPELIDPTMKPGDLFDIHIKVENAIDLYAYEFKLAYDTNVLTCLGAIVIPLSNDTSFTVELSIDDPSGVIWVRVRYYPPAAPLTIYTARTLMRITFMLQSYGKTPLDLYDTDLRDQDDNPISHEVEDGFFASLLRDVAIINVRVTSSNIVYPGRIVTIEVVAMNLGNMTIETFNVTTYYSGNPISTQPVTLDPWSNTTLIFHWNTSGLTPCNNFTIHAEASQVPYELRLDNNVFVDGWVKIKLLGDVNSDGKIDIYDITAACIAYNSRPGDPNWNPECDIAEPYDLINIYDVVTVCAAYGKSC